MLRAAAPIAFALLAAACSSTRERIFIQKVEGLDGAWKHPGTESEISLETTGGTVTLVFEGRTFVLEGLPAFKGHLARDEVRLVGRDLEFRFETGGVLVRSRERVLQEPMERFPTGGQATFRNGDWRLDGQRLHGRIGRRPDPERG